MNISIVIPNYNGEGLLKKNLPKVISAVSDVEIIVVDDASYDGSLEVLKNFKNQIKVVKNKKNLGFSSTVNLGVNAAKGDIVILLNTDVIPERGFLSPLLSHFKDKNIFAVGCMDKSIEGDKIILRGRGIGKWERGFLVHARGEIDKTNTLWVAGGSGAFRKSMWEKLGGFDELYSPFYWEDIDLSYRAIKSGFKVMFESKSVVTHEHEKGAIKGTYLQFQIRTVAYRNQFIFVWKNTTDIDLLFLHIFWLPYHFVKAVVGGDLAFVLGFFKAIKSLPRVMKSRINSIKFFSQSDKQVLEEFK